MTRIEMGTPGETQTINHIRGIPVFCIIKILDSAEYWALA